MSLRFLLLTTIAAIALLLPAAPSRADAIDDCMADHMFGDDPNDDVKMVECFSKIITSS